MMKKFGCILPSVLGLPWDLEPLLPHEAQALVVTLNVRNGRAGEHERALSILRGATDVLIDEGAQAIVVQGVPVAARRGYREESAGLAELTADRGAVPIISSLGAVVQALQHSGARKPLLITQYNDEVNAAIVSYFREMGLDCAGATGLQAGNAAQVNALTASDYNALARQALASHRDADGVFLSARANLLEVAAGLETTFDMPVIEQMQATAWWVLSRLEIEPPEDKGRLLASLKRNPA